MGRIACVELHALPLQLLLISRPEWKGLPIVVVDEDKPQGLILWANERARSQHILAGMRYSQALSLDATTRASTVSPHLIADWRKRIIRKLRHYSPHIDAGGEETPPRAPIDVGSFFLDASGLWRIYPSLEFWARAMHAELRGIGLYASIVVGYERFATYAIARATLHKEPVVLSTEAEEREAAERVRLDRLPMAPSARDMLAKLGVHHVGALMALPETGLRKHFGIEIERLVQAAKGTREVPLQNTPEELALVETVRLDEAEADCERLLFIVKRALQPLLSQLAQRGQALCRLEMHLQLERRARETTSDVLRENIAPHEPMLEIAPLMELVRLKLTALLSPCEGKPVGAVLSIALRAVPAPANKAQLVLFAETPKRDLRAAERAFARLRAEFGSNAVVIATEREGHLPEARFAWQPLLQVSTPQPRAGVSKAGLAARTPGAPREEEFGGSQAGAGLAARAPGGEEFGGGVETSDKSLTESSNFLSVTSALENVETSSSVQKNQTLPFSIHPSLPLPPPLSPLGVLAANPPRLALVPREALHAETPAHTVRRFFPQAVALASRKDVNDGWLIAGLELGAVSKLLGPYIQSGNWWRTEVQRDYYFAEVKRGDQLWVYFDHTSRSFFLAGTLA